MNSGFNRFPRRQRDDFYTSAAGKNYCWPAVPAINSHMLQTVTQSRLEGPVGAGPDLHLAAFRFMLLARLLDDKFAALYRTGKIHGGVFLGRGQEALSAAIGVAINKTDVFAPLIRDAAGRLAFGEPVLDAVRTYLGSALGPMRGRDGNVHRGGPRGRLSADDQPSRRDGFRGERRPVCPPHEGNFRHWSAWPALAKAPLPPARSTKR